MKTEKTRIFISHAWEDKELVRRLEGELIKAGIEVWVDHSIVRGGDNLPKRISDALEWCNTLLLVWSNHSSKSRWVELEWTNALSLSKRIIPCVVDKTKLPPILTNMLYIEFSNPKQGISHLLETLKINERIKPIHPLAPQLILKLPLRQEPLDNFSLKEASVMIVENDFFDIYINKTGKGIVHQYDQKTINGESIIVDHAVDLMWQQSGSNNYMKYEKATRYIEELNGKNFAGYNDWRLPTLEESMSLLTPKRRVDDLYIDQVFNGKQSWIWTADKETNSLSNAWRIDFIEGCCDNKASGHYDYVRAVRSGIE